MKKSKALLSILSLVVLASCSGKTENSEVKPSDTGSAKPTEPATEILTKEFTDEMLSMLKTGYQSEYSLHQEENWGKGDPYIEDSFIEFATVEGTTQFKQYDAVTNHLGELEKGGVLYNMTLSHDDEGNMTRLSLSLDNTLKVETVLDEDEKKISWADYGFANAFEVLTVDDFSKTENDYEFTVDLANANDLFANDMAIQIYGTEYAELESYKIKTDGIKPVSFVAVYKTLNENIYGSSVVTDIQAEGEFVSVNNADAIRGIKPLTGTEDKIFSTAMAKLASDNYEYEFANYQGAFKNDYIVTKGATGKAVVKDNVIKATTYFKDGSVNYDGAYYETETGLAEANRIGDSYYLNGTIEEGGKLDGYILPNFNISSLFFKEDKGVYTLDHDLYYTGLDKASEYSIFSGAYFTDLTITIDYTGEITFNTFVPSGAHSTSNRYVDVYKNVGGVEKAPVDITAVKATTAGLKWSDIFAENDNIKELTSFLKGKDVLDSIPTLEDNHSNFTLYTDFDLEDVQFQVAIDIEEGVALLASYAGKLKAAGFSEPKVDKYEGYTSTKTVTVDSVDYVLSVYFYADDTYGSFFVVCPSIAPAEVA